MKHVNRLLKPLSDVPLQAYLDNRLQLFDVLEFILLQTGPSKVYVSTFSTSEEFLRRLFSLRKRMLIIKSVLLADLKAARKTVNLYTFMSSVFDDVYLSEIIRSYYLLRTTAGWSQSLPARTRRGETGPNAPSSPHSLTSS